MRKIPFCAMFQLTQCDRLGAFKVFKMHPPPSISQGGCLALVGVRVRQAESVRCFALPESKAFQHVCIFFWLWVERKGLTHAHAN